MVGLETLVEDNLTDQLLLGAQRSSTSLSLSRRTIAMPTVENSTSSSSSFTYGWTYDVFISFRGVDTRLGFTRYLYKALYSKGINTFIDDQELGKGEEITPTLIKAIQESRIALVIFSKNYASSSFCLEELANIMECSKEKGMLVWPVFYQVDPSDVRHQNGSYAEALAKHEERRDKEKIEKWRAALKKAADLSGSHFKLDTDRYEYEFIENIVQEVSKKINRSPLYVANYPVGLESRVQTVKSLLDVESNKGVRMVGIYGIGKTTLACAVYNSIAGQFESLCFLADIMKSLLKNELVQLQETLLYELVGEKDLVLGNVNKGISQIRSKLSQKKVLLILDGVDKLEELRALTGGLDKGLNWFGSGSRIIITTRKKDLLRGFGVESTYEVKPLNHEEARELFSWNAFKRKEVNPIYMNISDRVIHYCKGLPLSLEKISSELFGKTVWECNSTLEIQKIPYIRDKDKIISKRKEKVEAHSYTIIIKVALDADLYEQIGKDIFFGLVNLDKVRSFRIIKQTPFILFKEKVAKELGIPVMYHRFWLCVKCQNHTYWPNRPLTPQEETQSVGQLREVSNKSNNAELELFLELEVGQDFRPIPPPEKSKEDLLLFFKLYDPSHKKLRYIGRLYVKASGKPIDILTRLNEMAGFALDEEIELFKEIKFDPRDLCERVGKYSTFHANELEDGDIICYQKAFEVGSGELFRYPDIPSFLEYVYNRQVVRFRLMEKPNEDEFSLELSKTHTYVEIVIRVAQHLGLEDPSKIRLTSHNCYSEQRKPQPNKYGGVERLSDMLVHYNQTSDILYYEIFDIPQLEFQCHIRTLEIPFHQVTEDDVMIHTIRLPKQSVVEDVINDLKSKVDLSYPGAELRLLGVFNNKIYKIFSLSERIDVIYDQYWTLRAEEILKEEKNFGPHDRLIHVCHFKKYESVMLWNFGNPFFLVIHDNETLADIKSRIKKKLQVPDEEFSQWKFAYVRRDCAEYLEDSDIVFTWFELEKSIYGGQDRYLGLEHTDNAP